MRLELGTKVHHMKHVLNNRGYLKPLFKYLTSMRRFKTMFGDVIMPKDKKKMSR
jgi:hypothetical protein